MRNLISVVIPFYSEVKWLEEALESVNAQTYKNIEVIVVDDGSKIDIEYLKVKFPNYCFVHKDNGGAASARNKGIKLSKGDYIAFLDSDDYWEVNKIEEQLNFMLENKLMWSQHSYYKTWDDGRLELVDTSNHVGNVLLQCFTSFRVQTSNVMVNRGILDELGIFFPEEFKNGQDGEFYKELAKKFPLGYVPTTRSFFRMRGSNVGFNTKVLFKNKSQVWNKIRTDDSVHIPKYIRLCFCISNFIWNKLEKSHVKNSFVVDVAYVLPYTMFKIAMYIYK